MNLQGRIKKIDETQQFSSGFKKRELVLTTQEQYPQDILIEFTQDKTDVLNAYNVGDIVDIGINIRGREWTNPEGISKYFNSIVGWKITKTEESNQQHYSNQSAPPVQQDLANEPDDLPF